LEKSPVYAETARGALELAGLGKVVKVSRGLFWNMRRFPEERIEVCGDRLVKSSEKSTRLISFEPR